jgi:porin
MKTLSALLTTVTLASASVCAAETDPWSSSLTGDWGGVRSSLADNGITVQAEYTYFYQGMTAGTGENQFEDDDRGDVFIDIDTGKLGLWEGGGLHTHTEYRSGNDKAFNGGALWPQFTGSALPLGYTNEAVATSVYLSQRFGSSTRLMLGKINAVDLLARDPFFGGWGTQRFMNVAFVAPPSGVVPPVISGAILNHTMGAYSLTAMMFDPDDQTSNHSLDRLFDTGTNTQLGVTWNGKLANRPSSLGINATYSTAEGKDLREVLLPAGETAGTEDGAYNVALQASHLLIESEVLPGKGLGLYGKAAIADGNPNVIRSSYIGGLSGYGMVTSRPQDYFGVGYFYYDFSNDLQNALAPLKQYNDEQGFEVYYTAAVLPWLKITADVQAVNPATAANSDVVTVSLRTNIRF